MVGSCDSTRCLLIYAVIDTLFMPTMGSTHPKAEFSITDVIHGDINRQHWDTVNHKPLGLNHRILGQIPTEILEMDESTNGIHH